MADGEFVGQTPRLIKVILRAYQNPFSLQSNYARKHANYVGMAASMGLLSTRVFGSVYSNEWRATMKGLGFLSIHLGEEFAGSIKMDWGHDD